MRMLESFFLRKATRCLFRTKTSSALHSVLIRSVSGSLALFVFLPTLLQARIGESYPAVLDCLDEQIDTHLYLRNAVLRYRHRIEVVAVDTRPWRRWINAVAAGSRRMVPTKEILLVWAAIATESV